jgi:hypothetical protein
MSIILTRPNRSWIDLVHPLAVQIARVRWATLLNRSQHAMAAAVFCFTHEIWLLPLVWIVTFDQVQVPLCSWACVCQICICFRWWCLGGHGWAARDVIGIRLNDLDVILEDFVWHTLLWNCEPFVMGDLKWCNLLWGCGPSVTKVFSTISGQLCFFFGWQGLFFGWTRNLHWEGS